MVAMDTYSRRHALYLDRANLKLLNGDWYMLETRIQQNKDKQQII